MKLGSIKVNPTLYEIGGAGEYYTGFERETSKTLPAGVYMIHNSMARGIFLNPKEMSFEKFIKLPDMQTNKIIADIDTFWKPKTKAKYEQLGLIYKRGILMYGIPGTGKTASIFQVCEDFVKNNNGVVIFNPDPAALYHMLKGVQAIEPDRKILVIFEEFDHHLDDTNFLSLLDGELQLSNIVYIATTNYIERVPERIRNRPSRFAQVVEVGTPTLEARTIYLQAKLSGIVDEDTLIQVAEKTEGFVLDQVKDVVISTYVFNYSIDDSVAKIKSFTDIVSEDDEEYEDENDCKPGPVRLSAINSL